MRRRERVKPSSSRHHQPLRTAKTFRSVSYIISYAPSTDATCKVCKQAFHAGKLRFGNVYETGDGSIVMRWHHLRCIRPPASMERVEQLTGLQEIRNEDVEVLAVWLNQNGTVMHDPDRASRTDRRSYDSSRRPRLTKAESTPDPLLHRPSAALRSKHRLIETLQRSGSLTDSTTTPRDRKWIERQPTLEWLPEHGGEATIRRKLDKNPTFRKLVAKPNRHRRFKTV